ncbi:hypothetical protein UT300003_24230 [Clostridium sardiniense]
MIISQYYDEILNNENKLFSKQKRCLNSISTSSINTFTLKTISFIYNSNTLKISFGSFKL